MHGVWRAAARALLRVEAAVLVDEHRLARRDVAHQLEAEHVERDALRRHHVFVAVARVSRSPEHQRADAVRIAERDQAVAEHHATRLHSRRARGGTTAAPP